MISKVNVVFVLIMLLLNCNTAFTPNITIGNYSSLQATVSATSFQQKLDIAEKILFISEKTANNLIINAIPEKEGYKWPIQFKNTYFNPGLHSGAAGVGMFFLALYNFTGNITYLKYAEGAAKWIISVARSSSNDLVTWCSYDDEKCWFLTPDKDVSGIIKFLLRLYNVTKNAVYLNYAEKGANWIITNALVRDRVGTYVLYNPPRQAAFGIYSYVQRDVGTLMIDLYMTTRNTKYLEIAKSIGDWIIYTSECDQYVCKWYDDRGYRNLYTVEGTSSIADLLYELYQVTDDNRYLEVAEKLVNWVENQGKRTDGYGLKFPNYIGRYLTVIDGYWDRPLFLMTPADIFIKSYLITRSVSRLNVAEKYANWIISISVIENNQAKVPFSEEQRIYHAWINARVLNFFASLYSRTFNSTYLEFMMRLLNYIESSAVDNNGFVWPRPDGKVWITFGLGEGSCAISYYSLASLKLLSLAEPPLQIIKDVENIVKIIRYARDKIALHRDLLDIAFYQEKSEEYRRKIYEKSQDILGVDKTTIIKELILQVLAKYVPGLEYVSISKSLIDAMEVLSYTLSDVITMFDYGVFYTFNLPQNSHNVLNDLYELLNTLDEMISALESREFERYALLGQNYKEKVEIIASKLAQGEYNTYLNYVRVSSVLPEFRGSLIKLNRIISDLLSTMDILFVIFAGTSLAKRNAYTIIQSSLDLPYISNFTWIVNGEKSYNARDGDLVVLRVNLKSQPFRSFSCEKIKVEVYEDIALWLDNVVISKVFDAGGRSLSEVNYSIEFSVKDKLFLRGYKFKVYGFGCSYPFSTFKNENWISLYFKPMKGDETYALAYIPSYPPGLRVLSRFPFSGVIASLTESGHRIHLRLEDKQGRVLGYKNGSIRNDFEGASYIVFENGIVATAPAGEYRVIVDTSEMSEDKTYYNLTILVIDDEEIKNELRHIDMTISKGEIHQYAVEALSENQATKEPQITDYILGAVLMISSLTAMIISSLVLYKSRKHR